MKKPKVIRQKDFNSVTSNDWEVPEYLKTTIDFNLVVSIHPKDYLALKCDLNSQALVEIDDLTIDTALFWINKGRWQ